MSRTEISGTTRTHSEGFDLEASSGTSMDLTDGVLSVSFQDEGVETVTARGRDGFQLSVTNVFGRYLFGSVNVRDNKNIASANAAYDGDRGLYDVLSRLSNRNPLRGIHIKSINGNSLLTWPHPGDLGTLHVSQNGTGVISFNDGILRLKPGLNGSEDSVSFRSHRKRANSEMGMSPCLELTACVYGDDMEVCAQKQPEYRDFRTKRLRFGVSPHGDSSDGRRNLTEFLNGEYALLKEMRVQKILIEGPFGNCYKFPN